MREGWGGIIKRAVWRFFGTRYEVVIFDGRRGWFPDGWGRPKPAELAAQRRSVIFGLPSDEFIALSPLRRLQQMFWHDRYFFAVLIAVVALGKLCEGWDGIIK